ncbi:MAG: ergothioneine biosynthesis protein EgtB [Planctomycetes bacterium]|jgi:formylglycine-generating enzyme required for sulfatase activity|nr:ergothioneine biosynthesis protein EgtB [Planctomycetota bacterium]
MHSTILGTRPRPAAQVRSSPSPAANPDTLASRYRAVRAQTEAIASPLAVEDMVIQSMEDVSPMRWHLAHTTWFFERFVLRAADEHYTPIHEAYEYLFNSYYNTVGPMHCRPRRGLLSRPTVAEVRDYRAKIDRRMHALLDELDAAGPGHARHDQLAPIITLGLQHEQQHQELMVTDIKHVLSCNPLLPSYHVKPPRKVDAKPLPLEGEAGRGCGGASAENETWAGDATTHPPSREGDQGTLPEMGWLPFDAGVHAIGRDECAEGFAFDNESPRHRVFCEAFELAARPVSNAEYLRFIEDGGYERANLWLALGWALLNDEQWDRPLYWFEDDGIWKQFGVFGPVALRPDEPVCHLSYFEADAYARWAGARLPTEAEWEVAATQHAADTEAARPGRFADDRVFHPMPLSADAPTEPQRMCGDAWEWTSSSYGPYPGYAAAEGALGEYNGKFMCNQYVLRGGSCATPRNHLRLTYRNFFPPEARWQYTSVRLARTR